MRGFRIGTVVGIPVRLNWTFLLVLPFFAALIAWDLGQLIVVLNEIFEQPIDPEPLTSGYYPWVLGFVSALGLFVGVLLHEFGHSLVAMRYGYDIDSITLWLLGGVASFEEFPEQWRHEFVISIAGPVVSVLVGIVSYVIFVLLPVEMDAARFVFGYLAILNVVLAAFNMLPGFPMDGGRILRALLARNQSHVRATQQAAAVGKLFAVFLAIFGLFASWFLIILAFFIYIAASSESQQTTIKAAFEGIAVRDIMTTESELVTITDDMTVSELLRQMFAERHVGYPVLRNGDLVGIVTLDDATAVEEVERDAYRVEDVMSKDVKTVTPDTDAMEAFRMMQEGNIGRIPVVDTRENLVGIISRTDIMRALDIIESGGRPNLTFSRSSGSRTS